MCELEKVKRIYEMTVSSQRNRVGRHTPQATGQIAWPTWRQILPENTSDNPRSYFTIRSHVPIGRVKAQESIQGKAVVYSSLSNVILFEAGPFAFVGSWWTASGYPWSDVGCIKTCPFINLRVSGEREGKSVCMDVAHQHRCFDFLGSDC